MSDSACGTPFARNARWPLANARIHADMASIYQWAFQTVRKARPLVLLPDYFRVIIREWLNILFGTKRLRWIGDGGTCFGRFPKWVKTAQSALRFEVRLLLILQLREEFYE